MSQKEKYPWLADDEKPDMADRMGANAFEDSGLPFRFWNEEQKKNWVEGLREMLRKDGWEVKEPSSGGQEESSDDYQFLRDPESWNRSRKT